MKTYIKLLFALLIFFFTVSAWAITWGVPDTNNQYPNVASIRGINTNTNTVRASCTGSLLYKDSDKYVILTAAHCATAWSFYMSTGLINGIAVSFDQHNVINGSFSDGTYYIRGGVSIRHPLWKPKEVRANDLAIVIFPSNAVNLNGQTIQDRWVTFL